MPKEFTTAIRESSAWINGDASPVDRKAGIIRGVRILGLESPNSHGVNGAKSTRYTLEALKEAKHLYEGIPVKWNHRSRNKPAHEDDGAEEKIGCLRNVSVKSDGLYGDLHYNRSHPKTPMLLEDAERPDLRQYSLSHDADGRGPVVNGVFTVHHIPEVRSVDVVYRGATNKTLFESQERKGKQPMKKKFSVRLREAYAAGILTPNRSKWLVRLIESPCMNEPMKKMKEGVPNSEETVDSPEALGDMETDMPDEGGSHEDMLKGGFEQALHSLASAALNGECDEATASKKFKELLKHYTQITAKEEPEAPPAEADTPESDTEGGETAKKKDEAEKKEADKKVEESLASKKLRDYEDVQRLLESSKRTDVTAATRKALMALDSDSDRRALLNEMTAQKNAPRSTSPHNAPAVKPSVPLQESDYAKRMEALTGKVPASIVARMQETARK